MFGLGFATGLYGLRFTGLGWGKWGISLFPGISGFGVGWGLGVAGLGLVASGFSIGVFVIPGLGLWFTVSV